MLGHGSAGALGLPMPGDAAGGGAAAAAIPVSPASRAPGTSDPVIRMSLAPASFPAQAVTGGVEPAVGALDGEAEGPLCEPVSGVPDPVIIGPVRGATAALGPPVLAAACLLQASKSA